MTLHINITYILDIVLIRNKKGMLCVLIIDYVCIIGIHSATKNGKRVQLIYKILHFSK